MTLALNRCNPFPKHAHAPLFFFLSLSVFSISLTIFVHLSLIGHMHRGKEIERCCDWEEGFEIEEPGQIGY